MTSRKPNIIYMYADDLGSGMLSCYGQRHFKIPFECGVNR
jgi:arylsulfatase A-like enzyme